MNKNKVNQPAEQKIVKKAWTPQENETLLKAVANKGNLSLNDVFVNFSKQTGRAPSGISQHYYTMTKNAAPIQSKSENKKQNAKKNKSDKTEVVVNKDKETLIQRIELMSPRALKSLSYLVGCMQF